MALLFERTQKCCRKGLTPPTLSETRYFAEYNVSG